MNEDHMAEHKLDSLLDAQGDEEFPLALGDRIMANLPDQNVATASSVARAVAFGGSLAASLAIGISLGLSDVGQDFEYAEEDIMAMAFGLADDEGEGLAEEN